MISVVRDYLSGTLLWGGCEFDTFCVTRHIYKVGKGEMDVTRMYFMLQGQILNGQMDVNMIHFMLLHRIYKIRKKSYQGLHKTSRHPTFQGHRNLCPQCTFQLSVCSYLAQCPQCAFQLSVCTSYLAQCLQCAFQLSVRSSYLAQCPQCAFQLSVCSYLAQCLQCAFQLSVCSYLAQCLQCAFQASVCSCYLAQTRSVQDGASYIVSGFPC